MKVDSSRLDALLADVGALRVALFFGEDAGQVRDSASRLIAACGVRHDDAFALTTIDRGSLGSLSAELAAYPLTGGRRVVRIPDAGDFAVEAVERALRGNGQGLAVIEAGDLTTKSKLRLLIEASRDGAAVACNPPAAATVGQSVRALLNTSGVAIDEDALAWLCEHLPRSHTAIVQHVGQLITYAGMERALTLADVRLASGEADSGSVDHALFSAMAGQVGSTDMDVASAMENGNSPVTLVRAALAHVQRLTAAQDRLRSGASRTARDAAFAARPPVFPPEFPQFDRALKRWTPEALERAAHRLLAVETACKRSGVPADLVASAAVLRLAHEAARS